MFFQKERLKPNCKTCGLDQDCKSPNMGYTGDGNKKTLIIAEAPGENEDDQGKQLVGESGQLYRGYLDHHNLDLDADFWKMNALSCRPIGNREPTVQELEYCKPNVDRTIAELKPKFIWLLGRVAIQSMYMERFSKLSISRWRRLCIPDHKTGAWIIPMYHPAYILRNRTNKNLLSTFDRDLSFAISCLEKEPPVPIKQSIDNLIEIDDVIKRLEDVLDNHKLISFDYETSALKPQSTAGPLGHKIWSIAVTTDDHRTFSFPFAYPHWEGREYDAIKNTWIYILRKSKLKKIAHNLKFEDIWSRCIFDIPKVEGWKWCTMNAAHILDQRQHFTGLKFQSYINYGIEGYDKAANKHKKPDKTGINTFWQMPLNKLLTYNGMDSDLTMRLFKDQYKILSRSRDPRSRAYKFFHDGLLALCDSQNDGINIDEIYYSEQAYDLKKRVKIIKKRLLNSKEAKEFPKYSKPKRGRELKIRKDISAKDLNTILFDMLKLESGKNTKKGDLKSTDEEVLNKLNHPFPKRILKFRKYQKLLNTYVMPYLKYSVNGMIYPNIDLHTTRSYRSSSSDPNIQNVPVRDPIAGGLIRKGIFPSMGHQIAEIDIEGAEVCTAACYTKDSSLIKYVTDPTTDMHRDSAVDLWIIDKKEVTKDIRFHSKGGWVFAQFYGSYYVACAHDLWKNCISLKTASGVPIRKHLRSNGINNIDDFIDHCEQVEYTFWKERFKEYDQWKTDINEFYRSKGYIETFLGFRYTGYLDEKQVTNYPIQGTAFHILLWSLIKLNKIAKREDWKTKVIGQIHDSILLDMHPDEAEHVLSTVKRVMTKDIIEANPWMIVPFNVDIEVTPIDAAWHYKQPYKEVV